MTPFERLKQTAAADVARHLGEQILFTFRDGNAVSVCAIFSIADVQIQMGGDVAVDSRAPMCNIRKCLLSRRPRQGDTVTRRDIVYEIKQVEETIDASYNCMLFSIDRRNATTQRSFT